MHEKYKYRHIPWNRYNLEKYRDINFWSYRPALISTQLCYSSGASIFQTDNCYGHNSSLLHTMELGISVLVLVTLLALVTNVILLFSYVCWQQK